MPVDSFICCSTIFSTLSICCRTYNIASLFAADTLIVEVVFPLSSVDGTGLVSLNGSTPAASADAWLPVGSTATLTYTPSSGYAIDAWTGLPESASYSDGGNTASVKVGGPLAIGVSGLELAYYDANFTSTVALPVPADLGNNAVYTFPAGSYTLVAKNDMTIMQALVVGGGGAGGAYCGGGGGGGGVTHVERPVFIRAGETLEIVVGEGGAVADTSGGRGGKGGASTLVAGDLDVTMFGHDL